MQLFTNNADSSLDGAIDAAALSLTLKAGEGAKFPTPTGGNFFLLTLYQKVGAAEVNHEIVKCTARAGDVLTVVRAQEGTTAQAFSNGDPIELRLTAGAIAAKQDALVSGISLKTINGMSLLGSGDLVLAEVNTARLSGDTTIYMGVTSSFSITDFDLADTYTVSVSAGSVVRTGATIQVTAPAYPGSFTLTVTQNGEARTLALTAIPGTVAVPSITSPTNGATGIETKTVTLTSSAFGWVDGMDTHLNSDWQLATDQDFTSIVQSVSASETSKTSWTTTPLTISTTYYARVRHRGVYNGVSAYYSQTVSFSTAAAFSTYIATPAATPAAFGDPFEGGFYAGLIWNEITQSTSSVSVTGGGPNKVFSVAGMGTTPIAYLGQTLKVYRQSDPDTWMLGTVTAAYGTQLTVNVTSSSGLSTNYTDWSIRALHRVIVAPKASGENASLAYKNADTSAPAACLSVREGRKATLAMVAAGSSTVYPAAHWCNNLTIAGRTDWYLPAKDELELCYRNLKPTAENNSAGYGLNSSSSPAGAAYTTTVPALVAAGKNFRTGEAEAFGSLYTTSTESTPTERWYQVFSGATGASQFTGLKTYSFLSVRAIRRSII